jgi:hypothetical protein
MKLLSLLKEAGYQAQPAGKIPAGVSRSTYMKDKTNLIRYLPSADDIETVEWSVDLTDSQDIKSDTAFIKSMLAKKGIKVIKVTSVPGDEYSNYTTKLEVEVPAEQSRQFVAAIESSGFEVL